MARAEFMATTSIDDEKPDMPTEEAAEYIGSKPNTMKRWRSLKKGPPYFKGLGPRILYRRSDLDRFIASRRIDTAMSSRCSAPSAEQEA
jgi:hypothetical protein